MDASRLCGALLFAYWLMQETSGRPLA